MSLLAFLLALLALLGGDVPRDAPRDTPHAPSRSAPRAEPEPSATSGDRTGDRTGERGPSREAWAALRWCESRGDYSIDTGNGYFGAYQFDLTTWTSVGGSGNPAHASPAEQDHRALLLWESRGSQPWPVCGRYLEE